MKRVNSLFARAGAICTSLALSISLFPAAAFATNNDFTNEQWNEQSRISVTAPVSIVFGSDGTGYDIQSAENPKGAGTFKNTGQDPVLINAIQYLPIDPDAATPDMRANGNVKMKDIVESVTIKSRNDYANTQTINSEQAKNLETPFILAPDTKTTLDYEVSFNAKNASKASNLRSDATDAGETAWPIGKIKYVFDSASFWLTDLRDENNPKTYSLPEVKDQALKVARVKSLRQAVATAQAAVDNATSQGSEPTEAQNAALAEAKAALEEPEYWEQMYTDFATYPMTSTRKDKNNKILPNYSCSVRLNSGEYDNQIFNLSIIGVNQDKLSEASTKEGDERISAGVTFIFADKAITKDRRDQNATGNNHGWKDSGLRQRMNFTYDPANPPSEGNQDYVDYRDKYKPIYEVFGSFLETVSKVSIYGTGNTHHGQTSEIDYSNDKLFLISDTEISGMAYYQQDYTDYPNGAGNRSLLKADGLILGNSGTDFTTRYMLYGENGYDLKYGRLGSEIWSYPLYRVELLPVGYKKYEILTRYLEGAETYWHLRTESWTGHVIQSDMYNRFMDDNDSSMGVVPAFCL